MRSIELKLAASYMYVDAGRGHSQFQTEVHKAENLSTDQILDDVWGIDFDTGTNTVDVYMHFIRKKLEANGLKDMLQTIRGRGYRLTLQD